MSLDKILDSPGLSILFADILLSLDFDDFAVATQLVCRKWRNLSIQSRLWWFKLLQVAPEDSYFRYLLENRSREFKRVYERDPSLSLEDIHVLSQRLCWRIRKGLIRDWKSKDFKIHKVSNARIVRDLMVMEHEVVFATSNCINIAKRKLALDSKRTDSLLLSVSRVMNGHRREISCFDADQDVLISGARDRKLIFWDMTKAEALVEIPEAHSRLITNVKLQSPTAISASRDKSIKIWHLDFHGNRLINVTLGQCLTEHLHSVWGIGVSKDFLVSGSADRFIRVWRAIDAGRSWHKHCEMLEHNVGVRNVMVLKCDSNFAISGDLFGEVKVWDLRNKCLYQEVPELQGASSWFRQSGAVVSMSECENPGYLAIAFGNHCLGIYDSQKLHKGGLKAERLIQLENLIEPGLVRCIVAMPTELYICNFSGKDGIVVLDVWD